MESSVIARLTWRLVPFLFLLFLVAYLDRINVGFAALQMREQLRFDDAVIGLGAGVFFAGYFLFQLPSNLILERVGARRWIAVLLLAWGGVSSAMIFVSTPRSFYLLRFLLGVAEAGFFPGVILYLRSWFPVGARARTVARFMTAIPLAGVVGSPLSGALLGLHGWKMAGWQWLFLLEGLPAVLLSFVVVFYLTDRPADAAWLPAEQRDWLVETLQREPRGNADIARSEAWAAFASGRIWLLIVVYFGLTACSYGITVWLPGMIRSLSGISNLVIGFVSAIPYVAAAYAMVRVGLHSDRTGERRWHVATSAFVGAAALASAAYSASLATVIVALSLAIMAVSAMWGPFWALAAGQLNASSAAVGIALINCLGNWGGFFGPYIIGWVRTTSGEFRGGLLVVAAVMVVSGCLALEAGRPAKRE